MNELGGGFKKSRYILLVSLIVLGCVGGDDSVRPPGLPAGATGTGVVTAIPDIEGGWQTRAVVTSDSCGALGTVHRGDIVLQITQAGSALDIKVLSDCGTLLFAGTGSVDGTGVVAFTTGQSLTVDAGCSLRLDGAWSATVTAPGDRLTGGATLTVSADGACGAGLPCGIESTISAQRCPAAGCVFRAC